MVSAWKGLMEMSPDLAIDGCQDTVKMWFTLWIVFTSIAGLSMAAMIWLILTMRQMVSIQKAVLYWNEYKVVL